MPEEQASSHSLDEMIARLEEAIGDVEDIQFVADRVTPPKACTFRVLSETFAAVSDREKAHRGKILQMNTDEARMKTLDNVVRGHEMELHIAYSKGPEGEVFYRTTGKVKYSKRVSGGYDMIVTFESLEKNIIPVHRRFLDFAVLGDFASWNRWYADVGVGADLGDMDLSETSLSNFDLCAANLRGCDFSQCDLSNANMSGADLSGCRLDDAKLTGADLFRVRIPRKYMGLLKAAGLVELESVILTD
jgi:hypothetical protein